VSNDQKPNESGDFAPPRWMTRVEKVDFRRVIDARKAVSNPVLATEFDAVCDYVSCRSRVAALRRVVKAALAECKDSDGIRTCGYPPDQRHAAMMIRQLDATTALSRRLSRDLQLTTAQED
jgi:hypothetical protein